MKISKLFHWLYAILMFLPIMVFIPNAFYYGFNEHAVSQEKTEQVPVYYDTNEVNSVDDIVVGNIYHYSDNIPNNPNITAFTNLMYLDIPLFKDQFPTYKNTNITYLAMAVNQNGVTVIVINNNTINVTSTPMEFIPTTIFNPTIIETYYINHIEESRYNFVKSYLPSITNMSITDSMSYAWDSVWQNPLFSWTYDSFLTQPFLYITNLFNVPATNALVYCLSYWLNLSIIWLTFDVVMYLPLLVHRWLDKGIIE